MSIRDTIGLNHTANSFGATVGGGSSNRAASAADGNAFGDHRATDGHRGALFLAAVDHLLQ